MGALDDMKSVFRKLARQHGFDADDQQPLKSCIKKRPHGRLDDGKTGLFKAKKKKKKKKVRFDGTADSAWTVAY